jgi:hypothetical protein
MKGRNAGVLGPVGVAVATGGARPPPARRTAEVRAPDTPRPRRAWLVSARAARSRRPPSASSMRVRCSARYASACTACRRAIAAGSPAAPTLTARGDGGGIAVRAASAACSRAATARASAAHAARSAVPRPSAHRWGGQDNGRSDNKRGDYKIVFGGDVCTTLIAVGQGPKTVTGLSVLWRVLARD